MGEYSHIERCRRRHIYLPPHISTGGTLPNREQPTIAYSFTLSHRPDMTEIIFKRT